MAFALSVLLPVVAQASVFLVQLGSHSDEASADRAWQELTQQSPEILAGLQHRKSEILLPPAGTKVYRLQAGPFQNRLQALKLCEELSPTGQDCFVVETVLFEPAAQAASPAPLAANVAPPQPAIVAPAVQVNRPAAPAFVEAVEDVTSPPIQAPVVQEMAIEKTTPVEQRSGGLLPWLADALPRLPWQSAAPAVPAVVPPALPDVAPAVSYAVEDAAPQVSLQASIPEADIAPPPPPPAPVISPALPAPSGARASLQPMPATNPQNTRYVPTARARRPVAPMPWQQRPAAQMSAPPVAPPMMDAPARQRAVTPPPATYTPSIDDSQFVGGNVEVAEAIPVPLSEDEPMVIPEAQPEVKLFSGKRAPGWGAKPSRNLLQQTYWANIHAFASRQQAMRFWEALRARLPEDAKGLRARITTPYARFQSDARVSLQLGPFRSVDNLNRLCEFARQGSLRCEPRKTMGATATAGQPRYRASSRWSNTRRLAARPTAPNSVSGAYWVQIGSFASDNAANSRWQDIQQQFTELDGMQPYISRPRLSSSANPVHRLRTGPFATRYAAQYTCDQLRMGGQTCLVVRE